MRMSQMAASVESRGINLIQSRLFLKACSSVNRQETNRQTESHSTVDSLLINYTFMPKSFSDIFDALEI